MAAMTILTLCLSPGLRPYQSEPPPHSPTHYCAGLSLHAWGSTAVCAHTPWRARVCDCAWTLRQVLGWLTAKRIA